MNKFRTEEGNYLRIGRRFKTNQGSRKGFIIKDLLVLQGPIRVRCLLPSPKREKVVIFMLIGLFILNMVKGIWQKNEERFPYDLDSRRGKCSSHESAPKPNAPKKNRFYTLES